MHVCKITMYVHANICLLVLVYTRPLAVCLVVCEVAIWTAYVMFDVVDSWHQTPQA